MGSVVCTIITVLLANIVSMIYSTRTMEGYPAGLLSDCPGSTKEAKITKNNLKHLSFILVGEGNFFMANRTSYNYFEMKKLAKNIDFEKKTVLYMPGYLDSSKLLLVSPAMGSVYKDLGYNVILLEYFMFSAWVYPVAVRFLRPVGTHVAEMLTSLTKLGLNPKNLELIGISHGGQGVSFIAKNYRIQTGINISRVTGLDPSGPCFRHLGPADRLDASDADLVDVIHTNIDGFGMAAAIGHVDFYVNGGEYQLGDIPTVPCSNLCSHSRAYTVWVAALLNPDSFIALQCDSIQDARDRNCYGRRPFVTNLMGPKTDKNKAGVFYLSTSYTYPYFMGKRGLKKEKDVLKLQMGNLNAKNVIVL